MGNLFIVFDYHLIVFIKENINNINLLGAYYESLIDLLVIVIIYQFRKLASRG